MIYRVDATMIVTNDKRINVSVIALATLPALVNQVCKCRAMRIIAMMIVMFAGSKAVENRIVATDKRTIICLHPSAC